jgi:dTDP-4-amino-4,6-dideoxygalactose transaminase
MTAPTLTAPIPLIDLGIVHRPIADELRAAFERVFTSGIYSSGPEVAVFERQLAEYLGAERVLGVGSGTSAIQIMLMAAGIGPGDEVIIPANTFWATAEGVHFAGATPVLADVDPRTALVDPAAVEAAITERTAAILPVHLYGQCAPWTELRAVAERHGLPLFEDSAQAIGARFDGTRAGALGLAASFSFYPGKNLGALGEAGCIATSDPALASKVAALRNHGSERRYVHSAMGFNERMDELQAAFLAVKLRRLELDQDIRDAAVKRYRELLTEVDGVVMFDIDPRGRHVHHLMVVQVPERDRVLDSLHAAGVGAAIHYPIPLHLQEGAPGLGQPGQFPVSERLASSILSLPLFPGITAGQVETCVAVLESALAAR